MKVIANGYEYECASAVKTEDSVFLYDENGNEFASFCGMKDTSAFVVVDGEWSEIPPSQLDQIEAQVTYTAMMTDTLLEV